MILLVEVEHRGPEVGGGWRCTSPTRERVVREEVWQMDNFVTYNSRLFTTINTITTFTHTWDNTAAWTVTYGTT